MPAEAEGGFDDAAELEALAQYEASVAATAAAGGGNADGEGGGAAARGGTGVGAGGTAGADIMSDGEAMGLLAADLDQAEAAVPPPPRLPSPTL